jgi:hypothetical protein
MRMPRTTTSWGLLVAVVLLAGTGCVRTVSRQVVGSDAGEGDTATLRSASNLPASFLVVTPARADGECPARLRDVELQVLLTLVRSSVIPARDSADADAFVAYGDYAIRPPGMYGDQAGEGLRIDCRRLRPLGVVRLEGG